MVMVSAAHMAMDHTPLAAVEERSPLVEHSPALRLHKSVLEELPLLVVTAYRIKAKPASIVVALAPLV